MVFICLLKFFTQILNNSKHFGRDFIFITSIFFNIIHPSHLFHPPLHLQIVCYLALFHSDYFNSRVSSYEKNILYAFNMPSFYGDGMRSALTFRLDIWKRLSLSAKLAHTHYWDRDLIGTDTEEISGSDKTDLYALLRWKF